MYFTNFTSSLKLNKMKITFWFCYKSYMQNYCLYIYENKIMNLKMS